MINSLDGKFKDFNYFNWIIENDFIYPEDLEEMIFSDLLNISEIVELIGKLRND